MMKPNRMNKYFIKNLVFLFLLPLCICLSSCDLINPEEPLSAFLQINKFDFTTTEAEGAASEQITDAWVFVEDISLGIYELPVTVPVIELGSKSVTIFPVIRENATPSTPIIYPFYERYEEAVELIATETVTIQPNTMFLPQNTIFELVEDFENSSHQLNGDTPDAIQIVERPTRDGNISGVGQILLDGATEVEFTSTATFLNLPTSGGLPVFLEIDYRTNIEFELGLVGIDPNPVQPINAVSYKIILCPIDRWNRVYVSFQPELAASQLPAYKLAFRASTNGLLANQTPEVLIDNVKFIRFQN